MSVFDFDKYKQDHPTTLELIRFIESMDVEDVKLANRSDYNVIESGEWIVPALNSLNGEIEYARATASGSGIDSRYLSDSTYGANIVRLSKMVWMEKGRSDAMEIGKVSVISGHGVRAKTSKVINGGSINRGDNLTIARDSDGVTKLTVASGSDVVKAVCIVEAGVGGNVKDTVNGKYEITFELVD